MNIYQPESIWIVMRACTQARTHTCVREDWFINIRDEKTKQI